MKESFSELENARLDAGFFVSDAIKFLGISRRTWYRWKESNLCPVWAIRLMKFGAGYLDEFGWKGWRIHKGKLSCNELDSKYFIWKPGDLKAEAFWRANGKRQGGTLSIHETRNIVVLNSLRSPRKKSG